MLPIIKAYTAETLPASQEQHHNKLTHGRFLNLHTTTNSSLHLRQHLLVYSYANSCKMMSSGWFDFNKFCMHLAEIFYQAHISFIGQFNNNIISEHK